MATLCKTIERMPSGPGIPSQVSSPGRMHASGCFGGDGDLEIHEVDHHGLGQLGLDDGSRHFQKGFVFEEQAALGDSKHRSAESEAPQGIKELLRKKTRGIQILQILLFEMKRFQVVENIFQACADEVGSILRVLANEKAESGLGEHLMVEIGCGRFSSDSKSTTLTVSEAS